MVFALAGVRVLDLATLFPAPLLAAMLGDLGADVVKVEPENGDPLRQVGANIDGTTAGWKVAGRNKRSVVVAKNVAADLAAVSDVVIVNRRRQVLERDAWDYNSVRSRNENVIYVSLTAFGTHGPYADRPGNGSIAEAFGGFAFLNGETQGSPTLPSLPLGDTLAAMSGMNSVLAALYARDVNGAGGTYVDIAMYEPMLSLLATSIAAWDPSSEAPVRMGSRIAGAAPRNVYRCADGEWLALSGTTDQQVARLLRVMGHDESSSAWTHASDRAGAAADALDDAVADWIARQDREAAISVLARERIPVAPVNSLADLAKDQHVRERGSLDSALGVVRRSSPALGEHTQDVLREWL